MLLSGASALVTRLVTGPAGSAPSRWTLACEYIILHGKQKFQVSSLAFINFSLIFYFLKSQKFLFSGCLLVSVDIMLYTILALLKDIIGQPIISED